MGSKYYFALVNNFLPFWGDLIKDMHKNSKNHKSSYISQKEL